MTIQKSPFAKLTYTLTVKLMQITVTDLFTLLLPVNKHTKADLRQNYLTTLRI